MTRDAYVLGVDPGLRETGFALIRLPRELVIAETIRRADDPLPAGRAILGSPAARDYIDALVDTLDRMRDEAECDGTLTVAVEDVVAPSPHAGMTNPTGLLGTAATLGLVLGAAATASLVLQWVTIRPRKHGAGHPRQYPPELLDRGGRVAPGGARRHERAAYDVAIAGARELRAGSLHPP